MKPFNAFKVALLGATALTLVSCGEAKEEVLAYDSVEACVKAGLVAAETCQADFTEAEKLHTQSAPRYDSANSCYADFGYDRCYRRRSASGGSFFLPFMMGYMMAPRGGSRFISSQPLYRTSSQPNRYYTAANGRVDTVGANGRTKVAKSKVNRPQARTRTVSRGGFGARATGGRGAGS